MNVLIACDSFKDALDAHAVCSAIEKGLQQAGTGLNTRIFPLSDGGEGMFEVLRYHLDLQTQELEVSDPLFRSIPASYGLSGDGHTAVIEMAQAAGLQLLAPEERNPLHTTTFGVGQMIADAISKGARHILLGIGGSATNDLGTGMAVALGWQFLDNMGRILQPTGGHLQQVARIVAPAPDKFALNFSVEVICDVNNPLTGPQGAAHVYAPQKGAGVADVELLEKGAAHFVSLADARQYAEMPGAGAAGGMGLGTAYFLGAVLQPGIEVMMHLTRFEQQVQWADVIITGEGRIDGQTARGKLISGIVAKARHKLVIAVCGDLAASPEAIRLMGLQAAFSITPRPCSLQEALASTAANLQSTGFNLGRLL